MRPAVRDRAGRDDSAARVRDLGVVHVAVRVDADDGIDEVCQHGHGRCSFRWARSMSAPAWAKVTRAAYL
jgi:hypothetical protein